MTRAKPFLSIDYKTHSSLSIATNLLLRCEHFFRSLAFLEHSSVEDPAQTLRQIHSLCRDFHETLYIIDQTLYRHRMQYRTSRRGRHAGADEGGEEDDDEGYRVLSEINEQLTDYAFLVGERIHPLDAAEDCIEPGTTSFSSSSSSTTAPRKTPFLPAKWKNRELRGMKMPLAGFRVEGD
ncbi:uncharacterized protein BHQ10_003779 [Talaromyces amestolkiae]|uniref:Uncharacterized protein n=1 Tax=Talaromyces amestolkiae TaxID=1196081 RepID=A0A364KW29_TALAM|nr:uncharacterized protein BHQ10_003779 [Talaromyces amestolkiae]RAO67767.1 hypothetical protein BHQ10_003779 [Talaromyces amestolkiae]